MLPFEISEVEMGHGVARPVLQTPSEGAARRVQRRSLQMQPAKRVERSRNDQRRRRQIVRRGRLVEWRERVCGCADELRVTPRRRLHFARRLEPLRR